MPIRLLVTDFDDTLWPWVTIWHDPFVAMMRVVHTATGIPWVELERDARAVFRRHGTSEYPRVLEEMACLQGQVGELLHPAQVADALAAHRAVRASVLRPFPGVAGALAEVERRGIRVVGYTESLWSYSRDRLVDTGLVREVRRVYSPLDLVISDRSLGAEPIEGLEHRPTPHGLGKPNPEVLRAILADHEVAPSECVYVGDSLAKDIQMAQEVGVYDAFAGYSQQRDPAQVQQLYRVSHWSEADLAREGELRQRGAVVPSFTLKDGFADVLAVIDAVGG